MRTEPQTGSIVRVRKMQIVLSHDLDECSDIMLDYGLTWSLSTLKMQQHIQRSYSCMREALLQFPKDVDGRCSWLPAVHKSFAADRLCFHMRCCKSHESQHP